MEETEAQIDVHNVKVLREAIDSGLEIITHEVRCLYGLLDDLAVYLPKAEQDS